MFSGLRSHILLITLLPPSLISLILGLYLNQVRHNDLNEFVQERGYATTRQFAYTAKLALADQQTALLQSWANSALEEKGLRSVSVVDAQGSSIVHAGPKTVLQPPYASALAWIKREDSSSFVMPVQSAPLINDAVQRPSQEALRPPQTLDNLWVVVEYNNDQYLLKRFESFFIQNSLLLIFFILAAILAWRLSQNL